MEGESHRVALGPEVMTTDLMIAERRIVVDDHLVTLPVALTRGEHDGAGFLEHGDEIGGDDGLREEVLGGAEEFGALPFPLPLADVIIAPVTGPDAEVTVLQTVGNPIG